jgi:hypothetical protein
VRGAEWQQARLRTSAGVVVRQAGRLSPSLGLSSVAFETAASYLLSATSDESTPAGPRAVELRFLGHLLRQAGGRAAAAVVHICI